MTAPATPGRREPVTRARIGEVALSILDSASDETALTMRALAAALGVQAPSLYAHIAGIDDVWYLVHARINSTIDLTSLDDPDPRIGLRRFAELYREAYAQHHVAATIIITRSVNTDHALAVYERVAVCLTRAGVPAAMVMPCMALLDTLALGSAIEPFADGFTGPAASYRKDFPHLAEALRHSRRGHIDDEGFALGLEGFIDLVDRLSEPGRTATASVPG
jgi:AcrR family transcriptional regulator